MELRVVTSPAAGRQALEAEQVDALLLLPADRLVFGPGRSEAAAVADSAVRVALRRHLPPAPELTTTTLPAEEETDDAAVLVAYAGSLLLLTSLAIYGQWVITGVVEEKSNRVVELILATVRPQHLLAGKVLRIGLLGFAQLVLVAGLAAALLVAGVFDAPAELGADMALVIPWFALGFGLYAVAYAAAGALASRQQNAETAGQPVTYTLLAVYFAGYVALSSDPEGLLASVLTVVFPLTAPLVLPARSALVGVPLWQHALAVVLVLGAIYALVRFAGRVYAQGSSTAAGGGVSAPRGTSPTRREARHPLGVLTPADPWLCDGAEVAAALEADVGQGSARTRRRPGWRATDRISSRPPRSMPAWRSCSRSSRTCSSISCSPRWWSRSSPGSPRARRGVRSRRS